VTIFGSDVSLIGLEEYGEATYSVPNAGVGIHKKPSEVN
jgi:hypothetical protein